MESIVFPTPALVHVYSNGLILGSGGSHRKGGFVKPRTYKFNALLDVNWDDISDENGWLSPARAGVEQACQCRSVGFFLNRDEKVLRISPSIQVKDKERGVIVIPWGCVTSIEIK